MLFFLAIGTGILCIAWFRMMPLVLAVVLSIFPLTVAFLGTIRRLAIPRFIETGTDAILISTGFLQFRRILIPYLEIEQTWEGARPKVPVFYLRAKGRIFEINSLLLPDKTAYVAIKDFVNAHLTPKNDQQSNTMPIEAGAYYFKCNYDGNGTVSNSSGEVLWHIKTPFSSGGSPFGFGPCPDFSFYDELDKQLLSVNLERRFLQKRFVMTENGMPVCTIRQKGILFTKYTMNFSNGQNWVFRLPLFTVIFTGLSKNGAKIRVRLWNHNTWLVLIDPNADNPQLVAALAFIHRERLRCI